MADGLEKTMVSVPRCCAAAKDKMLSWISAVALLRSIASHLDAGVVAETATTSLGASSGTMCRSIKHEESQVLMWLVDMRDK